MSAAQKCVAIEINGPIGARVVRHGRYVLFQMTEVLKDVVRDDWNAGRPVASGEFGRTDAASLAVESAKPYDRAHAHANLLRNFQNRSDILPSPNYTPTQVVRIPLSHLILACLPVRFLNLIRARRGIPPNSFFSGSALASEAEFLRRQPVPPLVWVQSFGGSAT